MADGYLISNPPSDGKGLPTSEKHKHIAALDGVRGLAILMVMTQHFTILEHGVLIDRIYGAVGRFGWTGVDLFFLLSGFLITGILLNSKGQANYFRNFYARRSLRVFPLYYILVAFGLLVVPHLFISQNDHFRAIPLAHWPYFWTYLSNFSIAFSADQSNDFFGITWSLAIEEQFYIVWPLIILFCSPKTVARICVGLLLMSVCVRTSMILMHAPRNAIYVLTPCRLDAISMGSLIAVVFKYRGLDALRAALPTLKWVAAAAALGVAGICAWHRSTAWTYGPGQAIGYTLITAYSAALVVAILVSPAGSGLGWLFSRRWLGFFGKYSYAIYLIHMPLMRFTRSYVYGPDQFLSFHGSKLPGQLIFFAICFVPSVALALLSWNLIEKRILSLKKFFPTHQPVERPATPISVTSADQQVLMSA